MKQLLLRELPDDRESASGFALRMFALNNVTGAHILRMQGLRRNRSMWRYADANSLSLLTGAEEHWFEWRLPNYVCCERPGREIDIFGCRWRADYLLRSSRNQICPICLRTNRICHWAWDLSGFCVCPEHSVVLQDYCGSCGRGLPQERPSTDICSCRGYISTANNGLKSRGDIDILSIWSRWLFSSILLSQGGYCLDYGTLPWLLNGLSIDGVYRMALIFGGGVMALQREKILGAANWVTSQGTADVLGFGLRRIFELKKVDDVRNLVPPLPIRDLFDQKIRGVTGLDRAVASGLLWKLRFNVRRMPRVGFMHEQGELFDLLSWD